MMKLQEFNYLIIIFFCSCFLQAQNTITGFITDSITNEPVNNVQLFNNQGDLLTVTNNKGYYSYDTFLNEIEVFFVKQQYISVSKNIEFNNDSAHINISLLSSEYLEEIYIIDDKKNVFDTELLKDFSSKTNAIYAGKKNEVILPENKSGTASNNARQMYNQTVSLNIYQTDDAGLQLNIGGRGLDPRRTSNFNVRQNGYGISADPLGYPESYYVPPFECLQNIELIRGAGSLQYGTQFGGLLNFNIKKPVLSKKIELLTRRTVGSHDLYTNFTSLSGTVNQLSYYAFYNYKTGNGFRPNSYFDSKNIYSFFSYKISPKFSVSFELTYMDYLAQQPGGLTDEAFEEDMFRSKRERNWFKVNWLLYSFQAYYDYNEKTHFSIVSHMLDANRYAIGFRSNRVWVDDLNIERDLLKSDFNNISVEAKILHQYKLLNLNSVFLFGAKFYSGTTLDAQGPGSNGRGAHFDFATDVYSTYVNQSEYSNPNFNYALFSENIIYLTKKMSLTPGVRFEYIKTSSEGYYYNQNTDLSGNVILEETIHTQQTNARSFLLFGLGYSYKWLDWSEIYANCSQNYRSVTFSDINIQNPVFVINPEMKDENGYTIDLGLRGNYKDYFFYDVSYFSLFYNDRIGFVQKLIDYNVKNEKGNVGDARISGLEFLLNFNLQHIINLPPIYNFNYFINISSLESQYVTSDVNGIEGKQVEFVPDINLKTGLELGYKNFAINLQYSYMSQQFTDASNAIDPDPKSGMLGLIPAYDILDFSASCFVDNYSLEFGINNLLDEHYFTNRATGYPGPGIIPSPTRNFYITFEYKF